MSASESGAGAPREASVRRAVPVLVVVASAILLLQAIGVLSVAVNFATQVGAAATLNLGGQVFLVVLIALAGVWLGIVGWGLWRGRAWSRSAAVVIQLFAVVLSFSFISAGGWALALSFLVPAAVCLLILFSTPVAQHLGGRGSRRG